MGSVAALGALGRDVPKNCTPSDVSAKNPEWKCREIHPTRRTSTPGSVSQIYPAMNIGIGTTEYDVPRYRLNIRTRVGAAASPISMNGYYIRDPDAKKMRHRGNI